MSTLLGMILLFALLHPFWALLWERLLEPLAERLWGRVS